jgi:hypothetical protein
MRVVLIFSFFISLHLNAQDPDRSALTAGSELPGFQSEAPNSITSSLVKIEYTDINYTGPSELHLSSQPAQPVTLQHKDQNNSGIYILTFLLVGIAVFFITSKNKNKTVSVSGINLEAEEDELRKKQLWSVLSEPQTEE